MKGWLVHIRILDSFWLNIESAYSSYISRRAHRDAFNLANLDNGI